MTMNYWRTGILWYLATESVVTVLFIVLGLWMVLDYGGTFLGILTVINLINLVFNFFGIYGVAKEKPACLIPFSVFLTVSAVVLTTVAILWPIAAVQFDSDLQDIFKIGKDIYMLIAICTEVLCFVGMIRGFCVLFFVLGIHYEIKAPKADAAKNSN